MRSYLYLVIGLALILFFDAATASRIPLDPRQDESALTEAAPGATTTALESSPVPATVKSEETSARETSTERQTEALTSSSVNNTQTVSGTSTPHTTSTAVSDGAQATGSTEPEPVRLPIQPKITPAIGLAGAILLISGAVYAVTGIRNKLLYISFSSAYLASLAVTVLIVYLMTPPVSDAVQGAYFVAAFMTGVVFGAISLVFSDITDGLGCLLGGFCLSMWFLTVKEGGLIKSTPGRAIFIGCMSVAAFAVSFSHYTKTYGLISLMSFAGATVTVLGIDCFSRAGLKEFWLYLWGLTPDSFPLFTDTYPLTRGIKAEIAGIVLLTVFGIVSQVKLWNIARRQEAYDAAERAERDRTAREEEEDVARRLQVTLKHGLAKWEKIYGKDARPRDSVIEPSNKGSDKSSASTSEKQILHSKSVELKNLPNRHRSSLREQGSGTKSETQRIGPSVIVTYVSEEDDEIQAIDIHDQPVIAKTASNVGFNDHSASSVSSTRAMSDGTSTGTSRSSLPSTATVVPLPIMVSPDGHSHREADNASDSATSASEYEPNYATQSPSKRGSGASFVKRFSLSKETADFADEEPIMWHIQDGRASSLAATLNDEHELDNVSVTESLVARTPMEYTAEEVINSPVSRGGLYVGNERLEDVSNGPKSEKEDDGTGSDPEPQKKKPSIALDDSGRQSLLVTTEPIPEATWVKSEALNTPPSPEHSRVEKESDEEDGKENATESESCPAAQQTSSLELSNDALPEEFSPAALSYRTDEWARHSGSAERPEVDDMAEPDSPVAMLVPVIEEPSGPADSRRPVVQPPRSKPKRTSTGTKLYRDRNLTGSTSHTSNRSQVGTLTGALQSTSRAQDKKGMRRSTTDPLLSTRNLNPRPSSSRLSYTPSPISNNTLLSKRENLIRNRAASHSLTPAASSTNSLSRNDDEDMTLAQRKQLLEQQRQSGPSSSLPRRQSALDLAPQLQDYNSHQRRRMSGGAESTRREVMLAGWRESLRQDGRLGSNSMVGGPNVAMTQRISLIQEKRVKEAEQHERALREQQRESVMENVMRSWEMLEAHREAMRRLQATVNKRV